MDRHVTNMYLHPVSPSCMSTLYHQLALTAWRSHSSLTHLPDTKIILRGFVYVSVQYTYAHRHMNWPRIDGKTPSDATLAAATLPRPWTCCVNLASTTKFWEVYLFLARKNLCKSLRWNATDRVFRYRFISIVMGLWGFGTAVRCLPVADFSSVLRSG